MRGRRLDQPLPWRGSPFGTRCFKTTLSRYGILAPQSLVLRGSEGFEGCFYQERTLGQAVISTQIFETCCLLWARGTVQVLLVHKASKNGCKWVDHYRLKYAPYAGGNCGSQCSHEACTTAALSDPHLFKLKYHQAHKIIPLA